MARLLRAPPPERRPDSEPEGLLRTSEVDAEPDVLLSAHAAELTATATKRTEQVAQALAHEGDTGGNTTNSQLDLLLHQRLSGCETLEQCLLAVQPFQLIVRWKKQACEDLEQLLERTWNRAPGSGNVPYTRSKWVTQGSDYSVNPDSKLNRLRLAVRESWGTEVTCYYGWDARRLDFTKELARCARAHPQWHVARTLINRAIAHSLMVGNARTRQVDEPLFRITLKDIKDARPDYLSRSPMVDLPALLLDKFGIGCGFVPLEGADGEEEQDGDDGDDGSGAFPRRKRPRCSAKSGKGLARSAGSALPSRPSAVPDASEPAASRQPEAPGLPGPPVGNGSQQRPLDEEVLVEWTKQYAEMLREFRDRLRDDQVLKPTLPAELHIQACLAWLGDLRFASLMTGPSSLDANGRDEGQGEAYVVPAARFYELSAAPDHWCPSKPVIVVGEQFNNESKMTVDAMMKCWETQHGYFPVTPLSVQNVHVPSKPHSRTIAQIRATIDKRTSAHLKDANPTDSVNLLDLAESRGMTIPRVLELPRFGALRDICALGPSGKSNLTCTGCKDMATKRKRDAAKRKGAATKQKADDIYETCVRSLRGCLSFAILGFTGSFSGAHLDLLNGTWLRCVDGVKAWMIAVDLTEDDIQEWLGLESSQRPYWCPEGKTRILILQPGDVLWMPPGVLVVHAPLTIRDCLMTGGMMWDTKRVDEICGNIAKIQKNKDLTNEDVPVGMATVLARFREVAGRRQTSE